MEGRTMKASTHLMLVNSSGASRAVPLAGKVENVPPPVVKPARQRRPPPPMDEARALEAYERLTQAGQHDRADLAWGIVEIERARKAKEAARRVSYGDTPLAG
jgi:hypothetical protein